MGQNIRLSTSDLATRFNQSVRTIRDWHTRGLLPKGKKDIRGHLHWTPEQITEFAKENDLDMEGTAPR